MVHSFNIVFPDGFFLTVVAHKSYRSARIVFSGYNLKSVEEWSSSSTTTTATDDGEDQSGQGEGDEREEEDGRDAEEGSGGGRVEEDIDREGPSTG